MNLELWTVLVLPLKQAGAQSPLVLLHEALIVGLRAVVDHDPDDGVLAQHDPRLLLLLVLLGDGVGVPGGRRRRYNAPERVEVRHGQHRHRPRLPAADDDLLGGSSIEIDLGRVSGFFGPLFGTFFGPIELQIHRGAATRAATFMVEPV